MIFFLNNKNYWIRTQKGQKISRTLLVHDKKSFILDGFRGQI